MMRTALLRQVNAGSQAHVAHAGAPAGPPSAHRPPPVITLAWEVHHVPQDSVSTGRHNTTKTIQNILKLLTDPDTGTDNWTLLADGKVSILTIFLEIYRQKRS